MIVWVVMKTIGEWSDAHSQVDAVYAVQDKADARAKEIRDGHDFADVFEEEVIE
jgi:hypothetical protein